MKKLATIFSFLFILFSLSAQIVNPVHWTGSVVGDSIRIEATIDTGWHMTLIELNDSAIGEEYSGTYTLSLPAVPSVSVRYNACDDRMCTAPEVWEYTPAAVAQDAPAPVDTPDSPAGKSLWWVFAMGLLGGLLAVFTPCVWPIIPMTVSFFIKRSGAARGTTNVHAVRDALLYGLSIIIIYVGLGLLVTLLFGASALNALSTNAVVNIIFFLILVLFAASFFGAFELTLPASWSTALSTKSGNTKGFLSILLMAFTLVIVSFSCTGPIIGTLLVEAAGKTLLAPAIGMLGFAIALALPFSLFALFPSVLKKLPKSGGWMNTFKVTLAFLELALSLKFLSVADLAYGWHILDREVFIALWVVIFALLGLYLLGLISFPNDDDSHRRTSVPRFFLAVVSLAFAIYMLPGLWGAPLRAVSAFAPPMSTQDWYIGQHTASVPADKQITFTDYDEGMAYARAHQMPVFLDFNGYGCVNCRKMEAAVLSKPEVEARLRNYVLISLIVDDKTKLSAPVQVEENGKTVTLKTIGDKWSYKQRTEYGANAQPFYIQLDADGNRLTPTAYSYDEDIPEFLDWLIY